MVIVSVQNVKGGCGKSTTAIHLACALAYMGRKVAIADGDPQNSALRWLKRRPAQLVRIDAIDFTKRDIGELKALKKRKAYDYIIIDGRAATRGDVLDDFVKASDIVLVPVVGLPMDIEVSQDFLKRLTHFRKIEKGKKRVAVVLNKVRAGGKIAARIAEIAVTLEVDIAARIPDKAGLQNPIEQGMTCFDTQRASNLSLRQCFIELAEYVDSSVSEQS
jgi:chromosome partitioning protein